MIGKTFPDKETISSEAQGLIEWQPHRTNTITGDNYEVVFSTIAQPAATNSTVL